MNGLNTIAILLLACVFVFLESFFDGFRNWFGVQVDVLPVLMVYGSLTADLMTVGALALVGGFGFDALSANPLGISVLPLGIIGFLGCYSREWLLRDQVFAQVLLGGASSCLNQALSLLLLVMYSQIIGGASFTNWRWDALPALEQGFGPVGLNSPSLLFSWDSVLQGVIVAACCAILAPVMFRLFNRINRAFSYPVASTSSFRPDREIKRGRSI